MRVLITGAGGQLGRELQQTAPTGFEITALGRSALDLTIPDKVAAKVAELQPHLIINAAAYTAVDRAEQERDAAFAVNAEGAGLLARAAADSDARLIQISTDFVFDGLSSRPYTPDDPPNPVSVYGASKLLGEQRAMEASAGRALVLRAAWVYSRFGKNFVKTMLRLMSEREEVEVVADQVGSPTWARGLAVAIWRLAERPDLKGIHHWTDAGVASWYDFAVAVKEEAQALDLLTSDCAVRPVATADRQATAPRPAFSVLDKYQTWKTLGMTPPHWREQLRRMLGDLQEQGNG